MTSFDSYMDMNAPRLKKKRIARYLLAHGLILLKLAVFFSGLSMDGFFFASRLIFFLGFGALLADSFPLLMIGSEGKD
jgi:hypothetical protein